MPRLDLNVHSRAIEINRSGSRHWFHKTSCNVNKLSRLYNNNVENKFSIDQHCERQTENRKTSCYNTNLGQIYLYATPSISFSAIKIYCRLTEETSRVNKTFTFYKKKNRFKNYATLIVIQSIFLCFYFHQSQAPYSLPYRQKTALGCRYKCRKPVHIST